MDIFLIEINIKGKLDSGRRVRIIGLGQNEGVTQGLANEPE